MIIKMIGYLLSFFLVIAVADPDCIGGINSQGMERGKNITFPIDHDKSGKEFDVTVALNSTAIAQLTCSNGICKLDPKASGSRMDYENGTVIIMNSSRPDEGIYEISYSGGSRKKNETKKCFNVTVIDDDNLPSTISPDPPSNYPSTTPAESSVGSRTNSQEHLTKIAVAVVVIIVVVGVVVFVIIWRRQKKKQNNSDAGVGAGDSVI